MIENKNTSNEFNQPQARRTGISHNEDITFPCGARKFQTFAAIIRELRDLPYEHLVVTLHSFHNECLFIQTIRAKNKYMVEIALKSHDAKPHIFRKYVMSASRCISIFRKVCLLGIVPNLSEWRDVSREIFPDK